MKGCGRQFFNFLVKYACGGLTLEARVINYLGHFCCGHRRLARIEESYLVVAADGPGQDLIQD